MLLGFILFSEWSDFLFLSFTAIHQCWDPVYDEVKANLSSSLSPVIPVASEELLAIF